MSRPLRLEYPGAVYHITCRGNEKKAIFLASEHQKIGVYFTGKILCATVRKVFPHTLVQEASI